jgi:lipooligosaccharide transport system permease protein
MAVIARRAPAPNPLAGAIRSIFRSRRLVERNLLVYRHSWIVIVSGFFEPLFYLLGIGYGLGTILGDIDLADGRSISYAAFVAPALLAQSSMNGAIAETIFNVFFKLNFARTYDGILATPLGIREIAIGEMIWALIRGTLYCIAFLGVMVAMGLVLSPWALLIIPTTILLGAAFSAAGLATSVYLRTVQDFDLPFGLVVMPMFLFSGTFFPITEMPQILQWLVELTPLYHGVVLIRSLSIGAIEPRLLFDLAYLLAFCAICLTVCMRQMERKLIK